MEKSLLFISFLLMFVFNTFLLFVCHTIHKIVKYLFYLNIKTRSQTPCIVWHFVCLGLILKTLGTS